MVETVFERLYSAAGRAATVRAAAIVNAYGLPLDFRRDLAQEAFLALWRNRTAYDPRRGSERTFAERVIANSLISLVRGMHSTRSGQFREDSLDGVPGLTAPNDGVDLRLDVWCVLAGISQFDRRVAVQLIEHSPSETSRRLGVSRATVYRAIGRLRDPRTLTILLPPAPVRDIRSRRYQERRFLLASRVRRFRNSGIRQNFTSNYTPLAGHIYIRIGASGKICLTLLSNSSTRSSRSPESVSFRTESAAFSALFAIHAYVSDGVPDKPM